MELKSIVFAVLNAKYLHASPAPFCLAAGVRAYAPTIYPQVNIFESTINEPTQRVLAHLSALNPAVLGFSCYIWNINQTLNLCKTVKEILPNTVIILGGPEVSYQAKDILAQNPHIDYISSGEGEESIPAFLSVVLKAKNPFDLLPTERSDIAGLCGREINGDIYVSTPALLGADVPSPLYANYAEAINGRIAYFETSRGCPYSCAFCLSGRFGGARFFDLDKALPELLTLANSGTQTIKFVDRTFNANAKHANKILRFILEHYGKEIPSTVCMHFEIAGDILREETFEILEQMPVGAVQLEIGMQSFFEPTLEAINRRTNSALLQKNVKRLVAMENMHIHIDLIAGLPLETLDIFAESFNTGYALNAQMLQLGFLKVLHGSTMRDKPLEYPCDFTQNPPYQITQTPWLSPSDIKILQNADDALDRIYNSGRLRGTAEYLRSVTGQTAFGFYSQVGKAIKHDYKVSLDDYTALLQEYALTIKGVDAELLRDILVRDRLATNSFGKLPACLARFDERLPRIKYLLSQDKQTAPKKGVRRGIAILYGTNKVCWADYCPENYHNAHSSWKLHEKPLEEFEL